MELIKHLIDQLARDEDGQDMVEYALILGLISIIAVAAVTATGLSIQTIWNNVSAAVAGAA
jgi:pilus assembly protein Flp/PilA